MKVIGLTGGIGTGKSTAAAYLKGKGFAHIDADAISRQLTVKGSFMLPQINEVFGPKGEMGNPGVEVLFEDGSLNRKALASLVFSDVQRKRHLDQLMFSAIIEEVDRQIEVYKRRSEERSAERAGKAEGLEGAGKAEGLERAGKAEGSEGAGKVPEDVVAILLDVPLLFESGLDKRCDKVILLIADETSRIDRVCMRDGVTAREVRSRINSQMSDEEKVKLADIVIDNSADEIQLYEKLDRIYEKII